MDNILKQFLLELYVISQAMQKKPPDENNLLNYEKGSGPQSLNE